MAPKKVNKEEKKRQIMMAAIKVFAEKGLKSSKIADIAAEAGIGKGTFYEYFTGRDEVFFDACNLMIVDIMRTFREIDKSQLSPIEKIHKLTQMCFEATELFTPEMSAFMMDFWAEGMRNDHKSEGGLIDIKPVYEEMRQIYQNAIQDGIDCGVFRPVDTLMFASVIIGIIDGLQIQWMLDPQIFKLNQMSKTIIDLFLYGIITKEDK